MNLCEDFQNGNKECYKVHYLEKVGTFVYLKLTYSEQTTKFKLFVAYSEFMNFTKVKFLPTFFLMESSLLFTRIRESMRCEESVIFFRNLAYLYGTFQIICITDLSAFLKKYLNKFISTKVPGIRLSPNISAVYNTIFLKLKMNK